MNCSENALLDRLVDARRSNRPLAILTDYDGTLTSLAPHPSWARLSAAARRVLAGLSRCPNVFVGVISGRSLSDLKELVGLPNLYYAGTSGLELDLRGSRVDHPQAAHAATHIVDWSIKLNRLITLYRGTWLERKPLGITVHYRQLDSALVDEFRMEAHRAVAELDGNPKMLDVSKGLEITPSLGWDKGTALDFILDHTNRDPFSVFAGDAANDGPALSASRRRGGLAIGVASDSLTEVDFWLESPEAFTGLLSRFLELISK